MAQFGHAELTERCFRRHWEGYSWTFPREIKVMKHPQRHRPYPKMAQAFGGQLTELDDGAVRAEVPVRALTFRLHPGNTRSTSFTTAK